MESLRVWHDKQAFLTSRMISTDSLSSELDPGRSIKCPKESVRYSVRYLLQRAFHRTTSSAESGDHVESDAGHRPMGTLFRFVFVSLCAKCTNTKALGNDVGNLVFPLRP